MAYRRTRRRSKLVSRKKALFKGGREVLKDAKEGVSLLIKEALNASGSLSGDDGIHRRVTLANFPP